MTSPEVAAALADAHARVWASVVAATMATAGDLQLAEECAQEAFAAALTAWERDGVPDRPGAWLTVTARRRAVDAVRREATLRSKLSLLAADAGGEPVGPEAEAALPEVEDDLLRLVFLCCHPALAEEAQVALTLRLVCGVDTRTVARLFLVSETTMQARLTRARKRAAAASLPFALPAPTDLRDRLAPVLHVTQLLFTAGYGAPRDPEGQVLAGRAVSLARSLHALLPGEPEVAGVLAQLLATWARRVTRLDAEGLPVRLEAQDRTRWDHPLLTEADALVRSALGGGRPGRYALQGAIATLYALAPTFEETDWGQLVVLYDELLRAWPTPVVALNRCVPLARADGPAVAFAEVERLASDPALRAHHHLHAVRADLLAQLGRDQEARAAWARAAELAPDAAERTVLARRAGSP